MQKVNLQELLITSDQGKIKCQAKNLSSVTTWAIIVNETVKTQNKTHVNSINDITKWLIRKVTLKQEPICIIEGQKYIQNRRGNCKKTRKIILNC